MIPYISISQLNLHKKNPRRWCLQYIEGIKTPPTKHLIFGSKVHTALEDLVINGHTDVTMTEKTDKRLLKWREENKDWLDKYQWNIETAFESWIAPDLPPFRGIIDMWNYDPDNKILQVYDHKTATRGYEETVDTISDNWQLILYAYMINQRVEEGTLKSDWLLDPNHRQGQETIIGHNQFFKNRDMDIVSYKQVTANVSPSHINHIIALLKAEARELVKTYQVYKKRGLQAVLETPENKWWFGRECELWPCIIGEESIDECKKRLKIDNE